MVETWLKRGYFFKGIPLQPKIKKTRYIANKRVLAHMPPRSFIKKFEDLEEHKKKVLTTWIISLNESIDFSPTTFCMIKFARMCEDILSKLWPDKDVTNEISVELYMLLEIFFKSGIFIGKIRGDKITVTDENLKQINGIKKILELNKAVGGDRRN
jgi:hypothetical protein